MTAGAFRSFDHPYEVEDITDVRATHWSDSRSLAVSIVLWLEYYDDEPASRQQVSRWLGGGPGARPYPDYARFAHREYGHRVGLFRLMTLLKDRGFPVTLAIDSMTAVKYPTLIDELRSEDIEYIAHGQAVTRMVTSAMSEDDERQYLRDTISDLERLVGPTRGWVGPEYSQSMRTPELLMDVGVEFCCDWGNDDHPFRLRKPSGSHLWIVPSAIGLDDSLVLEHRKVSTASYVMMIRRALAQLRIEAAEGRRSLVLNLRPYLSGQAFRASHLDELFAEVADMRDVWPTTPSRIVDVVVAEQEDLR